MADFTLVVPWVMVIQNVSGVVVDVFMFSSQANANAALAAFKTMNGMQRHPRNWSATILQASYNGDTTYSHKWS